MDKSNNDVKSRWDSNKSGSFSLEEPPSVKTCLTETCYPYRSTRHRQCQHYILGTRARIPFHGFAYEARALLSPTRVCCVRGWENIVIFPQEPGSDEGLKGRDSTLSSF